MFLILESRFIIVYRETISFPIPSDWLAHGVVAKIFCCDIWLNQTCVPAKMLRYLAPKIAP